MIEVIDGVIAAVIVVHTVAVVVKPIEVPIAVVSVVDVVSIAMAAGSQESRWSRSA